ncbi:hypothetical protein Tco_1278185 [Tanacetum coccineum]
MEGGHIASCKNYSPLKQVYTQSIMEGGTGWRSKVIVMVDDKREDVPSGNVEIFKLLKRIKIGSFKLRANIAKFEKNTSKSDQGCKRKGWVFDIPCKLNTLPTLEPSSSIYQTKVRNTLDGVPFEIDSISELHHIWSSFGATTCKVKYIGGSIFSLEFQNNEGCNLARVDYKKSVEQGAEFETGSNHVGDDFDSSSRDNVEPLGTTLKCETPNEVVQDGSEEEPSI